MSVEENLQLTKEFIEAYNKHDLDRTAEFWADENEGSARKKYQRDFWLTAFPDTYMDVISMTAQEERVAVQAVVRATHSGPLKTWVVEPVPATNKKIEFPYCSVGQWENGKLKKLHVYINVGGIISQLGVKPDNVDWENLV